MSLVEDAIDLVGAPLHPGASREGRPIELLVVVDDGQRADHGRAAGLPGAAPVANYAIDRDGALRRDVADHRAGNLLGLAIHHGRRRNLDRIGLSVCLEANPDHEHAEAQLETLHRLLPFLLELHGLGPERLVTVLRDARGRRRVFPYLPPPPAVSDGGILGAALDPAQELFVGLYAESYKPFGGTLKLNQAFPLHAAKFNLGAPIGKNEPPPVVVAGRPFNLQPYARDLVFNEGLDFGAVVQLSALDDPERDEIPAGGMVRAMLDAAYAAAIKAARARGVPIAGRTTLEPGWRFHQVAHQTGYGPPLSGNYLADGKGYAVQVFAGETLYTPVSDQSNCLQLSTTDPADPAYPVVWRETYKVARAPYDPNAEFHRLALELRLGAPLTGVYDVTLAGTPYKVQVWAFDTLYKGPDGQLRRMSELPKPPEVEAWQPRQARPVPPTPPNPLPPIVPPSQAGPPQPGTISWPPRPDFPMLTDTRGARAHALGTLAWVRGSGDNVRITNGWDSQHIVDVKVPQLRKIPGVRFDTLKFHRVAAEQFQRLWAAWEAAGLLHLIKTFDGAWVPRTIRLKPTVLSNHAYGTAFDINAKWNGLMRVAALVGQEGSVRELVPLANLHGFYWGGHFNYDGKGASDGMHFEWARPL